MSTFEKKDGRVEFLPKRILDEQLIGRTTLESGYQLRVYYQTARVPTNKPCLPFWSLSNKNREYLPIFACIGK